MFSYCLNRFILDFEWMFNDHMFILFYLVWELYLDLLVWVCLSICLAVTIKEKFSLCHCLYELALLLNWWLVLRYL
jgi:hypothetical protein